MCANYTFSNNGKLVKQVLKYIKIWGEIMDMWIHSNTMTEAFDLISKFPMNNFLSFLFSPQF